MPHKILICVIALILHLLPTGVYCSDFHSPRTASLGGAGHAGPLLNDAILLNPSFTSFLPTYAIGINYLTFNGPPPKGTPSYRGKHYNASIQDGRSEIFQAGASYTKRDDGAYLHLGASRAFIKQFGAGIGGKFFFPNSRGSSGRDMVFSTTGIVSEFLQAAFIIDNVFQTREGLARNLYREYILGLKLNLSGILLVYFDPHLTPSAKTGRYGFESGLEFVLLSDFFLRIGMSRNSTIPFEGDRGKAYGIGIGWVAPRISLDFAIQRALAPHIATAYVFGGTAYF